MSYKDDKSNCIVGFVNKNTKPNCLMKTLETIVFIFLIGVIITGTILFSLKQDTQKSIFGYRFYNVLTNSMNSGDPDSFRAGDMILVKVLNPNTLVKGDVITFVTSEDASFYLTHRIVDIKTDLRGKPGLYFITRGDANNVDDPAVSAQAVVGKKVLMIPYAGNVITFIQKNLVLLMVSIILFVGLIATLKYFFKRQKTGKNAPSAMEPPF